MQPTDTTTSVAPSHSGPKSEFFYGMRIRSSSFNFCTNLVYPCIKIIGQFTALLCKQSQKQLRFLHKINYTRSKGRERKCDRRGTRMAKQHTTTRLTTTHTLTHNFTPHTLCTRNTSY